mgnify:CR=1 FL=1
MVATNRSVPPDFINIKVDELSGDRPFRHIDDLISQAELREISDHYKKIAGFSLEALKGWADDSGEGRWTVAEAIDLDVSAPVITMS